MTEQEGGRAGHRDRSIADSITDVITNVRSVVHALKVTRIGNSLGVILPRETLARLRVEQGDVVYVTESPEGLRLTAFDPEFERQMDAARSIMKRRRNVLRELAK